MKSETTKLMSAEGQALVLASGGLDSSTLITMVSQQGIPAKALFIDFGQPAAQSEKTAVRAITAQHKIPLKCVTYTGSAFASGEVRGRNAFFLSLALMEFEVGSGTILIGIHAGTGYLDCSPEFVELMQRYLDFHAGGAITLSAPFIDWSKGDVARLASELGTPVDLTYSCETGNQPCGICSSCRDIESLGLLGLKN